MTVGKFQALRFISLLFIFTYKPQGLSVRLPHSIHEGSKTWKTCKTCKALHKISKNCHFLMQNIQNIASKHRHSKSLFTSADVQLPRRFPRNFLVPFNLASQRQSLVWRCYHPTKIPTKMNTFSDINYENGLHELLGHPASTLTSNYVPKIIKT